MTDDRKTPKEIHQENKKSLVEDIASAGKLFGAVLALFALMGMAGGLLIKWESFATREEVRAWDGAVREAATAEITKERAASEAQGYAKIKSVETEVRLKFENQQKDIEYIKDSVDTIGKEIRDMRRDIGRHR